MKLLVIASAEYVVSELAAEFGRIPPAFLPLGNRRLYEWQLDALQARYDRTVLTLPIDFALDASDDARLARRSVAVRRTPAGISFLSSLRQVLDELETAFQLDVLYGDTLASPPAEPQTDWYLIGSTSNYYRWHFAERGAADQYMVWAGMFSFGKGAQLTALLDRVDSFDAAVEQYGRQVHPLSAVQSTDWLDFGHVHTYYVSKRTVTTQRHFNELTITKNLVTKRSADTTKMAAEAHWFRALPPQLAPFTPAFAGEVHEAGRGGYATEYLALPTLSELLVFGRLPAVAWWPIFSAIDEFLTTADGVPGEAPAPSTQRIQEQSLYLHKTLDRLQQYARSDGAVPIDEPLELNGRSCPSLSNIALECAQWVLQREGHHSAVVHGDLCFSNILFDFRTSRVKLIDPRGLDHHQRRVRGGDVRYEVGKLAHSVLGSYDFIVSDCIQASRKGRCSIDCDFSCGTPQELADLFLRCPFVGRQPAGWDAEPIMVLLFLSMLPLHADRPTRQLSFVANALRLHRSWAS